MTDEVIDTSPLDPLALPMFDELSVEYSTRYQDFRGVPAEVVRDELLTYPAELFAPPDGAFVLIRRGGEVVGGGAFQRYDETTAELKRIWAHSGVRRQGVARRVVAELESRALRQGYRRVYLTTGFRQPEASALYAGTGYAPLYDPAIVLEVHWRLPFAKDLLEPGRTDRLQDLKPDRPLGRPFGA
ncbi:GNAT family N-acetyltransferase [Burkholderia cepacia]|uniref:GNAT family N-acetyltransferase n=1 Tax=Burkholderia cepacia TaxID=292 RepID=UPI0029900374|nr:GNAT family N-acetyltransferase [Burkholderia cepacia]MDW9249663.1 acetyltransferase domain protein [Burkholderia cepacia]